MQIFMSCPFFRRENSMRRDYEQAQAVMQVVLLISMIIDHSVYSVIRGCGTWMRNTSSEPTSA
jgi:hypothetical protein